jgi:hypothetical protein
VNALVSALGPSTKRLYKVMAFRRRVLLLLALHVLIGFAVSDEDLTAAAAAAREPALTSPQPATATTPTPAAPAQETSTTMVEAEPAAKRHKGGETSDESKVQAVQSCAAAIKALLNMGPVSDCRKTAAACAVDCRGTQS